MQFFLAEVTQVEVTTSPRGVEMVLPLRHSCQKAEKLCRVDPVPYICFSARPADFRAHAVILQITVAIFVDQNTPSPRQPSVIRIPEPGRPVGDTERIPCHAAERRGLAPYPYVTGNDAAVGVVTINATCTAVAITTALARICTSVPSIMFILPGREHDHHQLEYPARNVRRTLDLRELQRGLEQRVQHMEAVLSAANQVRSIFMPPKRRT